jgi:hypothetical protein
MALSGIRKSTDDPITIRELLNRVLSMDALKGRGLNGDITPPEVAEVILLEILKIGYNPDPFLEVKEKQNRKALSIYPWLKELVKQSPNPFATAVKVSIAGNLVDSIISDDVSALKDNVEKVLNRNLSSEKLSALWQKIKSSKLILFLGDNSGEIVFDRVLIEFIKSESKADLVYVVRSVPSLNDVTLKEASSVGMDQIVRVMENGISGPLPGTIISRCSPEMKEIFKKADLVISKGGGNYETFGTYSIGEKDTTFLIVGKCEPYCARFGIEMHDIIFENVYH